MTPSAEQSTFFEHLYPVLRGGPGQPGYALAWQEFWGHYAPLIRQWARRRELRDDQCDEIVSRVMLRLVEVMPRFEYDPARGFSPWLRRVVSNIIHDYWESLARHPGGAGAGGSSAVERLGGLPDRDEATDELGLIVETAMRDFLVRLTREAAEIVRARVKSTSWEAYQLLEIERVPVREVAARTGLKVAAALMARKRVREAIEEETVNLGRVRKTS